MLAAISEIMSLSSASVGPQIVFQGTDTSILAGYLRPEQIEWLVNILFFEIYGNELLFEI